VREVVELVEQRHRQLFERRSRQMVFGPLHK
jgi:hypothetical protein